jgi:hypothetical protein
VYLVYLTPSIPLSFKKEVVEVKKEGLRPS